MKEEMFANHKWWLAYFI